MAWEDIAPRAIASLSRDFKLTPELAAGIIGQLGFESEGLQAINERKPLVEGSKGGFGWAQWTGPRRKAFESWAAENNQDINTPEANYAFLVHELSGPEGRVLDEIRNAKDAKDAGRIFTEKFLRPGIPAQDKRDPWTQKAMDFLIPSAQAAEQPGLRDRIKAAKDAGYSDDEIKERLLANGDMQSKIEQARESGYNDDEIFNHLGFGAPQTTEQTQVQPTGDASSGGIMAGLWQGIRDPIDAGAQMLRRAVPDSVGNVVDSVGNALSDFGLPIARSEGVEGVDSIVNDVNQQYEANRSAAGRDGIDWARLGGNVAGTLPLMYATPQALAAGIGRVGTGAVQGAALGAMQPVVGESAQGSFGSSKAMQAGVGGALGAALPMATNVLAPAASRATSAAQRLASEGVQLTPGQALGGAMMRLEDKAMSVPIVGDAIRSARTRGNESLNRAVYNRVLSPIGEKTNKIGREAVSEARNKISAAYDDVLSKVQFTPDNAFEQSIANLRNIAKGLPAKERRAFEQIIDREVMQPLSKGRAIDGRSFKDIEANLGQQAVKFSRSTDAYQKDVGAAIGEVQKSLRENLQRMNPQHADRLRDVNKAYANLVRLENAAGKVGAQDGVFSPQQLANAVRSTDRSARKGSYARGDALMQDLSDAAQSNMSSKIPDSGTAGRLMQMGIGGGLGAGLMTSPTATMAGIGALGAASIPYLPGVSRAATKAILSRPANAQVLADALRELPPGALGALAGLAQ